MWSAARRLPAPAPPPDRPVATSAPDACRARGVGADRAVAVRDRIVHLWRRVPPSVIRWATVAMCVVAIAEAVVIARLLLARSTAAAAADTKAVIPPPRVEVLPIEPPPASAPPIVVTTATVDPKVPEIRARGASGRAGANRRVSSVGAD